MNNGGSSIRCQSCPAGFQQSLDGYNCIYCNDTCKNCDLSNSFLTEVDSYGTYLTDANNYIIRECIACNKQNAILGENSCGSCKSKTVVDFDAAINLTNHTCEGNFQGGLLFTFKITNLVTNDGFLVDFDRNEQLGSSNYFKNYLNSVYTTCKLENKTACQVLANMCTLNLYIESSYACKAFYSLKNKFAYLPQLKYPVSLNMYKSAYVQNALGPGKDYIKLGRNKFDNFLLAEYSLSGQLLSFKKFNLEKIILCNAINFHRMLNENQYNFKRTCQVTTQNLIDIYDSTETVFYEIYWDLEDDRLLQLPVKVLNYKSSLTADEGLNSQVIHSRFFLVDTISSKSDHIRYAKSMSLVYELLPGKSNGEIYPPLLLIEYDYVRTDQAVTRNVDFQIIYEMNLKRQTLAIGISLGVLGLLAIVLTFFKTWNWNNRSGKFLCDMITFFKFVMFFIDSVAFVFAFVIILASIYLLITYRAQQTAFIFLSTDVKQQKLVTSCVVIAAGLKFIDVVYTILVQTSYDIFMIDWERPKAERLEHGINKPTINSFNTDDEAAKHIEQHESKNDNKISCWRKLFVANEWNELQTFRKINISLQLLVAVFLLKGLDLERFSRDDNNEFNKILRIGLGSLVYITIGES